MSRPATCLASSNRSLCEWLLCARSSPCGCRRFLDFTQLNVAVKPIDPDPHRPPRRQGRYENPPPLRTCAALSFPAVLSEHSPETQETRENMRFANGLNFVLWPPLWTILFAIATAERRPGIPDLEPAKQLSPILHAKRLQIAAVACDVEIETRARSTTGVAVFVEKCLNDPNLIPRYQGWRMAAILYGVCRRIAVPTQHVCEDIFRKEIRCLSSHHQNGDVDSIPVFPKVYAVVPRIAERVRDVRVA